MVVHVYMYGANAVPGHQAVMEQLRTMQMEVAFGTFLDQSTTTVQRDLQSLGKMMQTMQLDHFDCFCGD